MMWRHILSYVPVNLANLLVSFGSIIILTRLLDAAEFGLYSLIYITMQFLHMAVFTWIEAAMARFHARAEAQGDLATHMRTCLQAAVIMATIGAIVFCIGIVIAPISMQLKTVLGFALGSAAFETILRVGLEGHRAAHRIGRFSFIQSSYKILSFTLGIALIMLTPLRVAGPFAGLLIGSIICLAIDLPLLLRQSAKGDMEWDRVRRYAVYGMPICMSLLLEITLSAGDRYFIAGFLGQSAVGEYAAGYGLAARGIDVLFIWLGLAATPIAITSLEKYGVAKTREVLHGYGGILCLVTFPAAAGVALVAGPLCEILIGESVRAGATQILPWITAAGVMNGFITYYIQRAFMLSGKTGMMMTAMAAPTILNLGLNFMLIPIFGLMGAVYATLISYGFGLVVVYLVARRYFPLPLPWEAFIKCTLATAAMAVTVINVPIPGDWLAIFELAIKATVGAATYGFVVFFLNAADVRNLLSKAHSRIRQIPALSDGDPA